MRLIFSRIFSIWICMEGYRSGHNGPDSKSWSLSGSSVLKNLDFTGVFGYSQLNIFSCSPHQFSPFSEVLMLR